MALKRWSKEYSKAFLTIAQGGTVDGNQKSGENSPVEGTVRKIPLFTTGFSTIQKVVGLRISEPSTLGPGNLANVFFQKWNKSYLEMGWNQIYLV